MRAKAPSQPLPGKARPVAVSAAALPLPLYTSRIAAGFPSPADDHLEAPLDLNEHLVKHPAPTSPAIRRMLDQLRHQIWLGQ